MKTISEQTGRLVGFQYDSDGFQFQIEAYGSNLMSTNSYYFPFNQNRPKAINFDEFRGKRVKVTVEMVEE